MNLFYKVKKTGNHKTFRADMLALENENIINDLIFEYQEQIIANYPLPEQDSIYPYITYTFTITPLKIWHRREDLSNALKGFRENFRGSNLTSEQWQIINDTIEQMSHHIDFLPLFLPVLDSSVLYIFVKVYEISPPGTLTIHFEYDSIPHYSIPLEGPLRPVVWSLIQAIIGETSETNEIPLEGVTTEPKDQPEKASESIISLQRGKPGLKLDPKYDQAFKDYVLDGNFSEEAYKKGFDWYCNQVNLKKPDKKARDAFKAAMRRRRNALAMQ